MGDRPFRYYHSTGIVQLTDEERAAKLRQARDLIAEVRASLDKREMNCEHCNRVTYSNWPHHNMDEPLKAMVQKLERFTSGFENNGGEKKE